MSFIDDDELSRVEEEREDARRDESQDYRVKANLTHLSKANAYRRVRARCLPLFDLAAHSTPRLQDAAALLSVQIIATSIREVAR